MLDWKCVRVSNLDYRVDISTRETHAVRAQLPATFVLSNVPEELSSAILLGHSNIEPAVPRVLLFAFHCRVYASESRSILSKPKDKRMTHIVILVARMRAVRAVICARDPSVPCETAVPTNVSDTRGRVIERDPIQIFELTVPYMFPCELPLEGRAWHK